MLYNNGYRLGNTPFKRGLGALTTLYNGGGSVFNHRLPTGNMRASAWLFGSYAGRPVGNLHPQCWMLPQKAGDMSMRIRGEGELSADLIPTRAMSIDMTGSGDLAATAALVVSMACAMSGSGSLSASIVGYLNMSADFTGSGNLEATMSGIASMAIDMLGQGDLDATIAAYGNMSIDIVVTGTGLSTANVGAAVWNALSASFDDAGTMGEKMNDAGSAGDPWSTALPGTYTAGQAGHIVGLIQKILRNKTVTDPTTGTMTVYDDDGVTPLFTANLYEDAAGTTPYSGDGAERKDRLT